jgi:hypothetical protein
MSLHPSLLTVYCVFWCFDTWDHLVCIIVREAVPFARYYRLLAMYHAPSYCPRGGLRHAELIDHIYMYMDMYVHGLGPSLPRVQKILSPHTDLDIDTCRRLLRQDVEMFISFSTQVTPRCLRMP